MNRISKIVELLRANGNKASDLEFTVLCRGTPGSTPEQFRKEFEKQEASSDR